MSSGSLNTIGGGAPSATEPTLSVAGVTDGEVATVTAGARSLSITAQSGATLLTTVNDKDGPVAVTGSTTATPSWTAPGGGTTGNACQVHVTATLGGLVSEVSRTELVVGSGGSGPGVGGSELLATWAFAGADTGALSASGTITTDAGATNIVDYVSATQSGTVASETRAIVAAGLEITREDGASIGIIALNMANVLAACDPSRDKLLALVKFASITSTPATNQNCIVAVSAASNTVSSNPNRGVMLNVTAAGTDVDVNLRQYTSGVTTVKLADYGTAMPTGGSILLEIDVDRVRGGQSDSSSPDRVDVTVGTIGGSSESPSATLPSAPWNYLQITNNPQTGGTLSVIVSSIEWYRLTQGAT